MYIDSIVVVFKVFKFSFQILVDNMKVWDCCEWVLLLGTGYSRSDPMYNLNTGLISFLNALYIQKSKFSYFKFLIKLFTIGFCFR